MLWKIQENDVVFANYPFRNNNINYNSPKNNFRKGLIYFQNKIEQNNFKSRLWKCKKKVFMLYTLQEEPFFATFEEL